MRLHTTPLDREILTHFYVSGEPFPRSSPHINQRIADFVQRGLLIVEPPEVTTIQGLRFSSARVPAVHANMEALKPYMNALGEVPLPVQSTVWTVPR